MPSWVWLLLICLFFRVVEESTHDVDCTSDFLSLNLTSIVGQSHVAPGDVGGKVIGLVTPRASATASSQLGQTVQGQQEGTEHRCEQARKVERVTRIFNDWPSVEQPLGQSLYFVKLEEVFVTIIATAELRSRDSSKPISTDVLYSKCMHRSFGAALEFIESHRSMDAEYSRPLTTSLSDVATFCILATRSSIRQQTRLPISTTGCPLQHAQSHPSS
jgi:hypothetical protein